MQYFILPLFLYILSSLTGTVLLNRLKIRRFVFNSLIGFSFILACLYVLYFPLVMLNVNISVLIAVTAVFFAVLLFFIFKDRKDLKPRCSYIDVIAVILMVAVQIWFASRNTTGSLWRYDTVSYTNLIAGSIYGEGINSIDWSNGYSYGFLTGYSFQSFYKLASVLYCLMLNLCNAVKVNFYIYTQHVWMYALLLYTFISELIVNFIHELNIRRNGTKILIVLFFIFFMGNFYWNSEQAYLGNSFRMIMLSYLIYYLSLYFKEEDNKYLWMLIIFNYANSACANSNTTTVMILTFVIWAVSKTKKGLLKYMAASLYLPLINCMFQAIGYRPYIEIGLVTVILVLVIVLENFISWITDKLKLKIVALVLVGAFLTIMSYRVTGNFFDFSAFLDNWSGWNDMTWDYTDFSSIWRGVGNICYFALMIMALIKYKESTITKALMITVLVFFNPFACEYQEVHMYVFYRNYDIVINYFTLLMGFKFIDEIEKNQVRNIVTGTLAASFIFIGYNQLNYHPGIGNYLGVGFEKSDDYNCLLKMNNDTDEALQFIKEYLKENKIEDCEVISSIPQIRTEFPHLKTLYNRGYNFNGYYDDQELFKVFYHDEVWGEGNEYADAHYGTVNELLDVSTYTLVIQDSSKTFYDYETETHVEVRTVLKEHYSPIFENETYSIFRIH